MKTFKVLCAMLVCGSPVCELSVAAEADPGARHAETAHGENSTNHGEANQERGPEPARDGRGADHRSASDTRGEQDHTPAAARDRGRTDQRSASDAGAEHQHAPAAARDRDRTDQRSASDIRTAHDRVLASARDAARTGRRSTAAGSAAGTNRIADRPRQAVQSGGAAIPPNTVRAPQADDRIAGHADPGRVSSSRESVATANLAQRQRALPDFRAADRPIRGIPAAVAAGAVGGPGAAGGPQAHGAAFVGGPAPAKITNSGTINGTAARRGF
jgi:hypothetical protein